MTIISECKAEKHTSILCQIEDIFKTLHSEYKTYLSVHNIGRSAPYYKKAEKRRDKTFYQLMFKTDGINVKNPDAIVVENDSILYVIEVKWGYLKDYPKESTDLKSIFEKNEFNKMENMMKTSKSKDILKTSKSKDILKTSKCEVIGEGAEFHVLENTKFLVVSDLKGLKDSNIEAFNHIKNQYETQYKNYRNQFIICDIKENVDKFSSLNDYLRD